MSMDLPLPLSRFAISHRKPHYNHHRSNYAYVSVKSQLKKKQLEGVSEELNLIATQSLDHAPARRRVRSVFVDIQQQLDHPLFKMAPDGIKTKEWYEMNSKGMEIFCKSWMPELGVKVKGVVCFCHGYGDTCTFFFEGVARRIADAGYAVFALDHPGFGLSDGLHGYISSFDQLADNVNEIYRKIKGRDEFRGLPFFILGQSMGGAITLKAHLMDPFGWDGIILVAPMCKIAEEIMPPQPVMKALIMMSKWMPKAKLVPQQDLAVFSFRDLNKRNMTHFNVIGYNDQVRLKTAVELLNATKDIEAQVDKVSAPLLILHGAADKVTDPLISKFLYEKAASRDKTLKLYEGGYHSILEGEPDDRILSVFDDIISWLDVRSCPV